MPDVVNPGVPSVVAVPAPVKALRPVITARATATVQTMPDGTRVSYRADGTPLRQWNPDGSVLTYDAGGAPAVQTLPDGSTLTFHPDGTVTERLPDRTVIDLDVHGRPIREVTPDLIVFDSFDGRGRPLTGTLSDGTLVRYDYRPDGDVLIRYSTGLVQVDDAQGRLRWEKLSDGTRYTSFDDRGRPTAGIDPIGRAFTLTYDARGDALQRFPDGSTVETDPNGHTIREITPDGTTFTAFDDHNRPTRGLTPGGAAFTLTYDAQGDVFEHLPDGSTVETDPNGHTIREITPDGTTFTAFDSQGRPTAGTASDGTHFTITYDSHGDVFEHLGDGTVIETDPSGKPITMWTPDGTEINFAVDIPALHNAIGQVSAEREAIVGNVASLKAVFTEVESMWDSPAGMSFHPLADTFNTVTDSLVAILGDAVSRMRSAYNTYVSTEGTNANNLH